MTRLSQSRAKKRQQEAPPELTVNVRIEEPGGTFNTYSHDPQRGTLRLAGVHQRPYSGLERGTVLNTLTEDGGPLEALIPVASPTSKGCIVEARVIGGVQVSTLEAQGLFLVGVPAADPARAEVRDAAELLPAERQAIDSAAGFGLQRVFLQWIPYADAEAVVKEATKAYWQDRAENHVRYAAAWKAQPLSGRWAGDDETEAHTWAEYLIPSLPFRFQKYVEELLLPDERILFFVERPSFVAGGAWAALRRQKLRQGLLVITDRQVMAMLDSLPPDSTMVDWGYIAKVSAVERLTGAWVDSRDSTCEIGFVLDSAGGAERYAMTFPAEHREALEKAVKVLKRFAGAPASTAARRLYYDMPPASPTKRDDEETDLEAKYPHLRDLLARIVDGDNVVATAAARPVEGRGLGPALVLTANKLALFPGGSRKDLQAGCREYPVAAISSVEVTQSLISCRFEVFLPAAEEVDRVTLKYNYPDAPPFLKAFIALRHLLGRPISNGSADVGATT